MAECSQVPFCFPSKEGMQPCSSLPFRAFQIGAIKTAWAASF